MARKVAAVATTTVATAATTAATAAKVDALSRTTDQVHETVAATAATTEVVHTLVNDSASKALEEIKMLRDSLAELKAAEARNREHATGQLRTRATDKPRRVNRRRKRRE